TDRSTGRAAQRTPGGAAFAAPHRRPRRPGHRDGAGQRRPVDPGAAQARPGADVPLAAGTGGNFAAAHVGRGYAPEGFAAVANRRAVPAWIRSRRERSPDLRPRGATGASPV